MESRPAAMISYMSMRQVHCSSSQYASKPIQIFYEPAKGHNGIQEFLCPYCRQTEKWGGIPGEISRILINGPVWQEYYLFQRNKFETLDELKTEIQNRGFTRVKRDAENAKEVALKDWTGFSSHISGGAYAMVTYYLEGNRLRVHKALQQEDHWYTLS